MSSLVPRSRIWKTCWATCYFVQSTDLSIYSCAPYSSSFQGNHEVERKLWHRKQFRIKMKQMSNIKIVFIKKEKKRRRKETKRQRIRRKKLRRVKHKKNAPHYSLSNLNKEKGRSAETLARTANCKIYISRSNILFKSYPKIQKKNEREKLRAIDMNMKRSLSSQLARLSYFN